MQSRLPLTSLLVYIRVIFDPFSFFKVVQFNNVWNSCDAMLFIVRSPCTWLHAHPSRQYVCMYPDNSNAVCVHAFRQPAIAVYIPSGRYREVDWCLRVPPRLQQAAPAGTQAISLWRRLAHNSDNTACTLILISSSSVLQLSWLRWLQHIGI